MVKNENEFLKLILFAVTVILNYFYFIKSNVRLLFEFSYIYAHVKDTDTYGR